jgi:hypothetical protein
MAASSLAPRTRRRCIIGVLTDQVKPGKARRPAKHASPEKRLFAGKATTPIGLASS